MTLKQQTKALENEIKFFREEIVKRHKAISDLEFQISAECKHKKTKQRTESYHDHKTPYFEYQETYCVNCGTTINK
tara:strand:+ start:474 stop:701 length:228 start_codon:yes stop_codon:yes gene_type:complete